MDRPYGYTIHNPFSEFFAPVKVKKIKEHII